MQQPPSQAPFQPQPYQQQQPPPQSPPPKRRKSRAWLWIVALILVALISFTVGRASGGSTPDTTTTQPPTTTQATSAPTKAPAQLKWTTTHTYSGNGAKKTETFAVPDSWKIVWSCSGVPAGLDNAPLFITVYNSDGSIADSGVQYNCKLGAKNGDSTEEHKGGNVYLDVNSGVDWTIQIQELK